RVDARALEPFGEATVPPFVVHAGGQLGDVVGRGVGLEPADLPEVVDGMAGMPGRSSNAKDEKPPTTIPSCPKPSRHPVDRLPINPPNHLNALVQKLPREVHPPMISAAAQGPIVSRNRRDDEG